VRIRKPTSAEIEAVRRADAAWKANPTATFRTDSADGAPRETEQRMDLGSFGALETSPSGGLIVPAYLTRVGIFLYRNADGSTRRELRSDSEVFSTEAIASLRGAPLTELHPDDPVTPQNWQTLSIGHVGDDVKRVDGFVASRLYVQDAAAIGKVTRKDLRELSCGYECALQRAAGTWCGEPYDVLQRRIRYNHVALGPSNWGRAGNDVRIRVDSADRVYSFGALAPANKEETKVKKITIKRADGSEITFDKGSDEHIRYHKDRADSAVAAAETATARADTAEANAKAEKTRADAAEAKLQGSLTLDQVDAAVDSRVALLEKARSVIGSEFKADSTGADGKTVRKSDRQIREEVIAKVRPELKLDGKSDEYVATCFDLLGSAPSTSNLLGSITGALPRADGGAPAGGGQGAPEQDAATKLRTDSAAAGTGKLALSKD
jgi:hypothetical protein